MTAVCLFACSPIPSIYLTFAIDRRLRQVSTLMEAWLPITGTVPRSQAKYDARTIILV
jgi:hypothetical protein